MSELVLEARDAISEEVSPQPARSETLGRLIRSEPVVLAAMLVSLGIYYMVPGLWAVVLGLAAFFALTLYHPDLQLAMVPLAIPLFYHPRYIGSLYFPIAEVVIVIGVAAWALRDGFALLQTRKLPSIMTLMRQPGVWTALALGVIGLLWLLVPPSGDLRKVAFRDFRWTVVEPIIFFALMLRWLRSERDIWRMVGAWLIAAALVCREGVEQFLFGETWSMEGVGRVSSVYPSATAFGIYVGRALPLAMVLAIFLPPKWRAWRIACALLALVMALGVLFSFARGAWIGVFVALLAVAIVTRTRWMLASIGAAVLAGLAGLALLPFIRVERITSMFNFTSTENTGLSRLKIWISALNVLRDHPITGIGQDQFLYQDPDKYGIPQIRFLTVSHPHNFLLDFYLRLGVPGIVWIVIALIFFFRQSITVWKKHAGTQLGALALGLFASMIDFAVHGLLDMAYFTMDLALTFWLTVGVMMLLKRTPETGEA